MASEPKMTGCEGGRIEYELNRILGIIAMLRSPSGCLWDRQQTISDVGTFLMDEVCEVLDAIESGSLENLKEELGDLLFQVFFMAIVAKEEGNFDIGDIMAGASDKMIRRHPHVFGNLEVETVDEIRKNWELIKSREREDGEKEDSIFQGVPRSLPALRRAFKVSSRAARVGFDWRDAGGVLEKVLEEIGEIRQSLLLGDAVKIEEEMGDLLFSVVNLCRHANVDPDRALRGTVRKFVERFSFMAEKIAEEGKTLKSATMGDMDRLWELSKSLLKPGDIK
ncbi:MAG: nucleoside triphosphate pyrophosphohydrolase [Syntrophales bacterium]|nr:nucleoside triphosphate pyrophosphohydrolase [Syntrophales bacterium]